MSKKILKQQLSWLKLSYPSSQFNEVSDVKLNIKASIMVSEKYRKRMIAQDW